MTLIEVVTAAGIVAFALCGLMLTFMNFSAFNSLSEYYVRAGNAMQSRLEEISALPFANLSGLNNTNFTVAGFPSGDATGVIQVSSVGNFTDLRKVRLVVSFRTRHTLSTNGTRVIGEDANLDGILNASEEAHAQGKLEMVTMIANFTG